MCFWISFFFECPVRINPYLQQESAVKHFSPPLRGFVTQCIIFSIQFQQMSNETLPEEKYVLTCLQSRTCAHFSRRGSSERRARCRQQRRVCARRTWCREPSRPSWRRETTSAGPGSCCTSRCTGARIAAGRRTRCAWCLGFLTWK